MAGLTTPERSYGLAMAVLAGIGLVGLGATLLPPSGRAAPVVGVAPS